MLTEMQDVLVIGSGFGGSIAASRLVDAGVKVTLLERGPWRDSLATRSMGIAERAPYAQGWRMYNYALRNTNLRFMGDKNLMLNHKGMFEFFRGNGLWMLCSSGVGGGSQVYGGLHERPLRDDYWDGHCDGLSSELMEPLYQSIMQRFGSRELTEADGIPNTVKEVFKDSPLFTHDNPLVHPALGMLMPEVPGSPKPVVTEDGIKRHEVQRWNIMHMLGSPDSAKSTLDFIYLAEAMRKGLNILDMHEACMIRRIKDNGTDCFEVDMRDRRRGRKLTMRTKRLILAAGTLNTLRLLLTSRAAGGLQGMPQLGKRLGSNGDTFGAWLTTDPDCDHSAGLMSGVDFREDPTGLYLLYAPMAGLDELKIPGFLKRRLARYAGFGGMGEDAADGEVTWNKGRIKVDYDANNSPIYNQFFQAFDRIEAGTGHHVSAWKNPPWTPHQSGGACVGQTIDDGVVDVRGEVFDNPGLYITDAAALPGAVGAPPSMSVAAWSSFVAQQFVDSAGQSPMPVQEMLAGAS